MKNSCLKSLGLALLLAGATSGVFAQSVLFPQEKQAGVATAVAEGNQYVMSNDLFSVTFVKENGTLRFGGSEGMPLVGGTELFKIQLADGTEVPASKMNLKNVELTTLSGDAAAVKGSHHFNGHELKADFTYGDLNIAWSAVLRDGSHYLRTKMALSATQNVAMKNITPMLYEIKAADGGVPAVVGNTRGAILASKKIFAGVESPMGVNSVKTNGGAGTDFAYNNWTANSFKDIADNEVPKGIVGLKTIKKKYTFFGAYGPYGAKLAASNIVCMGGDLNFENNGNYTITFNYASGNHRLNIAGVDVVDANGKVVAHDYHCGFAGTETYKNAYSLNIPKAGVYTLRYFAETKTESITSSGNISFNKTVSLPVVSSEATVTINGLWERTTTLAAGQTWNIGAVVGLIAKDQARRSVLAYSERERAVPWRPMPIYNSWYELNIDRNNATNPENNMRTEYTAPILEAWKANLFDKYGVGVKSFVWDDGWDNYKTWECHSKFDFAQPAATAQAMGSGTGVWLGPVGGYGKSGDTRRAYWRSRGGMQLSNPDYYKVFYNAVTNFVTKYNGNYFKLDGISAQFSSVGPDAGVTGLENAELIIGLESHIRDLEPDIFLNTSVGTWASPFWFRYTDAVWRQEGDYGESGNNNIDRERWITYRDRLVYQNFVQNSPLCPINTMMVHGIILTKFGQVSKNMDREGIIREMRCAFASGNAMVEIYCDHELLTKYNLWGELAECIKWQQKNADVLPDIHWVGGNPWDGSKENVYGWASWNGEHATLALRNGSNSAKTFTTTLRKALDIPAYVNGNITLNAAFAVQNELQGMTLGQPIDIDATLTLKLAPSSAYVFGTRAAEQVKPEEPDVPVEPEDKPEAIKAAVAKANEAIAKTGVGCPAADAKTRVALQKLIDTPTTVKDIESAINAFMNETNEIEMPEDGKTYTLASVAHNGKKSYFVHSGSGLAVNKDAAKATAYTCKLINGATGEFAFVAPDGTYLVWKGPNGTEGFWFWAKTHGYNDNKGFANGYDATYCDLTLEKLTVGGHVSAKNNAELFGLMTIKGMRYSRNNYSYFAIAPDGSFDGANDPYFNGSYSSAIMIEAVNAPVANISIDEEDDDDDDDDEFEDAWGESTGIDSVLKEEMTDAPVYDLSGRRVLVLVKGKIYIKNGKKFIAK